MSTPRYPDHRVVRDDARESLLPPDTDPADARLLWVHAHPDDESIATGASIAHYARLGASNAVLTMTRGERGEVIPQPLAHLEVGAPGCPDTDGTALGLYRVGELDDAVAALGASDRFFAGQAPALDPDAPLGPAGRYVDSGMSWGPDGRAQPAQDVSPAALTSASVAEAAAHVAAAIRALRPHAVITYCDDGGYGHPDHVRTHRVSLAAVELAAAASSEPEGPAAWDVPLTWGIETETDLADERTQAAIHGDLAAKRAAMAAHATQIVLHDERDGTFELSNGVAQPLSALECFRLLREADR